MKKLTKKFVLMGLAFTIAIAMVLPHIPLTGFAGIAPAIRKALAMFASPMSATLVNDPTDIMDAVVEAEVEQEDGSAFVDGEWIDQALRFTLSLDNALDTSAGHFEFRRNLGPWAPISLGDTYSHAEGPNVFVVHESTRGNRIGRGDEYRFRYVEGGFTSFESDATDVLIDSVLAPRITLPVEEAFTRNRAAIINVNIADMPTSGIRELFIEGGAVQGGVPHTLPGTSRAGVLLSFPDNPDLTRIPVLVRPTTVAFFTYSFTAIDNSGRLSNTASVLVEVPDLSPGYPAPTSFTTVTPSASFDAWSTTKTVTMTGATGALQVSKDGSRFENFATTTYTFTENGIYYFQGLTNNRTPMIHGPVIVNTILPSPLNPPAMIVDNLPPSDNQWVREGFELGFTFNNIVGNVAEIEVLRNGSPVAHNSSYVILRDSGTYTFRVRDDAVAGRWSTLQTRTIWVDNTREDAFDLSVTPAGTVGSIGITEPNWYSSVTYSFVVSGMAYNTTTTPTLLSQIVPMTYWYRVNGAASWTQITPTATPTVVTGEVRFTWTLSAPTVGNIEFEARTTVNGSEARSTSIPVQIDSENLSQVITRTSDSPHGVLPRTFNFTTNYVVPHMIYYFLCEEEDASDCADDCEFSPHTPEPLVSGPYLSGSRTWSQAIPEDIEAFMHFTLNTASGREHEAYSIDVQVDARVGITIAIPSTNVAAWNGSAWVPSYTGATWAQRVRIDIDVENFGSSLYYIEYLLSDDDGLVEADLRGDDGWDPLGFAESRLELNEEFDGFVYFRIRRGNDDSADPWQDFAGPVTVRVAGIPEIEILSQPTDEDWAFEELEATFKVHVGDSGFDNPSEPVAITFDGAGDPWSLFYDAPSQIYTLVMTENGTYTITVKNSAGVENDEDIIITSIDATPPTFRVDAHGLANFGLVNESALQREAVTFEMVLTARPAPRAPVIFGVIIDGVSQDLPGVSLYVASTGVARTYTFFARTAATDDASWDEEWVYFRPITIHIVPDFDGTLTLTTTFVDAPTRADFVQIVLTPHGNVGTVDYYRIVNGVEVPLTNNLPVFNAYNNGTYTFLARNVIPQRDPMEATLVVVVAGISRVAPIIANGTIDGGDVRGRTFRSNLTLFIENVASLPVPPLITDSNGTVIAPNFASDGTMVFSKNGGYTVLVVDAAGNENEVSFFIDKPDYTMIILIVGGSIILIGAIAFLTFTTVRNRTAFKRLLAATSTGEDPGQFIMYKKVKK